MKLRILVVNGERTIATMLKVVLEASGNSVTLADSAGRAEDVLDNAGGFDLAITDVRIESHPVEHEAVGRKRACDSRRAILELKAFPLLGRDWRAASSTVMLTEPINVSVLLDKINLVPVLQ